MGPAALSDAGGPADAVITYDSVPPGEIAVHRGDPVHATDGPIGHVQGLVVDPSSHISKKNAIIAVTKSA